MKTESIEIYELGPKGDGIARHKHETVFIARTLPKDIIEAKWERDDEGTMRGTITRIVKPSPDRITPACKHYDHCGGCSLQHAQPSFYQQYKKTLIHKSLDKYRVHVHEVKPVHFLPANIRRRATFAVLTKNGKLTLGYFARRSHIITHIDECMVCDPKIIQWRDRLADGLTAFLQNNKTTDLFIQLVNEHCDVLFTGPIGVKGKLDTTTRQAIIHWAQKHKITRVAWRAKAYDLPDVLYSATPITIQFGAFTVPLPAGAFLQPSVEGETTLAKLVLDALPKTVKTVADLFSGCGTFSGYLAQHGAKTIHAYDNTGTAINALKTAMKGTPHTATTRDLFKAPLLRDTLNKYDCVVFDPPRAGAQAQCEQLAKSKVPLVIAVSCNQASFARDAAILQKGGYKLNWVAPVDQFIWSHHIELVAKFSK